MTGGDVTELARIWREQIPLSVALDIRISDWNDAALVTTAPLTPNVNLHGTAFAGSLYSIAALTGWGFVWLLGRAQRNSGDIVLARADIDYLKPVRSGIACRAAAPRDELDAFAAAANAGKRAKLTVECEIGPPEAPAARFHGRYLMHAP